MIRARNNDHLPPMDRLSFLAYGIVFSALLIECAAIWLTSFTYDADEFLTLFYLLICLIFIGMAARRYGLTRFADVLEGIGVVHVACALTGVSTVMLSRICGPFADDLLVAVDRALGFDWLGLFRLYQTNDWLMHASAIAYRSLYLQLPIVVTILFIAGHRKRGWGFITAVSIAGLLTAAMFPFAPAEGAYVHFGITPADIPTLNSTFPWEMGPAIEGIKNGTINELASAKSGLVSFPSFHTVCGVLFIWAMWPVRRLRLLFLLLNSGMIFATVVRGAHYLIDIIGGGTVAMIAIVAASAYTHRVTVKRADASICTPTHYKPACSP